MTPTASAKAEAEVTTIDPEAELDLEGDGLQPFVDTFLVAEARVTDSENGQRWEVIFEAENKGEDLINGKVRDSGFLTYTGDSEYDLVKMGRGQLKRLIFALTGTNKASLPSLEGQRVQAYVSEDKSGFPKIGRYKAISKEASF